MGKILRLFNLELSEKVLNLHKVFSKYFQRPLKAEKLGFPAFSCHSAFCEKENIVGNKRTVFPWALSVQRENGITVFLCCLQYNTLLSHQHNFSCIIITAVEIVKGNNTTFTGFAKCSSLCT